jgi:heat shock protein HslJ
MQLRTIGNRRARDERRSGVTKTRPFILLALPLLAVATLAACGSDSDGASNSDATPDSTPTDSAPTDSMEASVPATNADSSGLDGQSFVSTEVEGYTLVPDSTITISFQDGSVSVNAGCNTMFGGYTVTGDVLSTPTMAMTQMACDPALMEQDTWISALMSSDPTFTLDGDTLTITGSDAQVVTFAAVADRSLEGVRWVVDGLLANEGVSTVPIGAEASITITDGTAAVEAGCNTGSAPVTITDTTITFGPLMLTRMACPEPQTTLENAVVAVLDGEVAYAIDGDSLQLRKAAESGEIGLNLTAEAA